MVIEKNGVTDVVFFIEHKDREFDSITAIAKDLKNKFNLTSAIFSIYFHAHDIHECRAKLFVLPFFLGEKIWRSGKIVEIFQDHAIFLNLNWEQLLSPSNAIYKAPRDFFSKNTLRHISWDDGFKNDFLIKHGVNPEHIYVTGNPANELLHREQINTPIYREKLSREFRLNSTKRWLFFPMNYGWAFLKKKSLAFRIKNGYPRDIAYAYADFAKKGLLKFIRFLEIIAQTNDFEIIIRPHPSITTDDYIKIFKANNIAIPPNVHFHKNYTIKEWIIASDIIGSSWSTSVWDAYNIGKATFYFKPFPWPEWLNTWWLNAVPSVSTPEEFVEKLPLILNNPHKAQPAVPAIHNISSTIAKIYNESKLLPDIHDHEISKKMRSDFFYYLKANIKNFTAKHFFFLGWPKGAHHDYFRIKKYN